MSKILIKALKSAILPSSLLIAGKFLSVFIIIAILSSGFSVTNNIQSIFSIQVLVNNTYDAVLINSISNLVCLILIALPTFYMLIRSTLLKDAQKNPRVVVKLTKLNILKWVTGHESSLIKITIWIAFLWIITGITIASTVNLETYPWIGVLSGVLSLIAALGILKTFEKETDRIYPEESNRYI